MGQINLYLQMNTNRCMLLIRNIMTASFRIKTQQVSLLHYDKWQVSLLHYDKRKNFPSFSKIHNIMTEHLWASHNIWPTVCKATESSYR